MTLKNTIFGTALAVLLPATLAVSVPTADAANPRKIPPPCRDLATYGPIMERGFVSYTGGGYCPEAISVTWKMTINRGGVPWVSRTGPITTTPSVKRRCVRGGPPITYRAVLTMTGLYASGAKRSRTVRGQVWSLRCKA